jgi:hypothetical protein
VGFLSKEKKMEKAKVIKPQETVAPLFDKKPDLKECQNALLKAKVENYYIPSMEELPIEIQDEQY